MKTSPSKARIVIVGGGFGGVRVARQLSRHNDFEITLISDSDNFSYYPQFYRAATGGARAKSSLPLPQLVDETKVKLVRDRIATIHPDHQTITGVSGAEYQYDELVLALGSITNYFGIAGLHDYAYNIKTIEGAEAFKQHLHQELIENQRPELHYVVVGAGPTGVELAASLGQYLRRIVKLHGISAPSFRVDLVEASPRILPRSSERFAAKVEARLRSLGVRIMTDAVVEGETADGLQLKGKQIVSKTVVWTAGTANSPFFAENASWFTLAKNGRVEVNEHLEGREHVYVIGDNAATKYGGQAETAVNDANFVADDMVRKLDGEVRPAYRQSEPSTVIPVGTGWGAAQFRGLEVYGYAGWILRRLADLIAYSDVEALPRAIRAWLGEANREDDCRICSAGDAARLEVPA